MVATTLGATIRPALAQRRAASRSARCAAAPRAASVRAQASLENALRAVRPAVALVATNALLVAPALAEPGKIFDFNLTLPLMAGQFLILMVVLDKLVYKPVGAVLDARDSELRTKLEAVKDNAGDLLKYTTEADGIIRSARDDAAAEISKAKTAADKESAAKIAAAKAKLDAELKSATAALEAQRASSMASLDTEVNKLSEAIVTKVLATA